MRQDRPNKGVAVGVQFERNSGEVEVDVLREGAVNGGSRSVRNMACERCEKLCQDDADRNAGCNTNMRVLSDLEPRARENFARVKACEVSVLFSPFSGKRLPRLGRRSPRARRSASSSSRVRLVPIRISSILFAPPRRSQRNCHFQQAKPLLIFFRKKNNDCPATVEKSTTFATLSKLLKTKLVRTRKVTMSKCSISFASILLFARSSKGSLSSLTTWTNGRGGGLLGCSACCRNF